MSTFKLSTMAVLSFTVIFATTMTGLANAIDARPQPELAAPIVLNNTMVLVPKPSTNITKPLIKGSESMYFVLALQRCDSSSPWSIHGLWPQYSNNNWPSYCSNAPFSKSDISDLWSDLLQNWDTCSWSGKSESEFLGHEWTKHGTCSGYGEHTYFSTTLQIFNEGQWRSSCSGEGTSCKVNYNLGSQ